jgi:hypothetical protein
MLVFVKERRMKAGGPLARSSRPLNDRTKSCYFYLFTRHGIDSVLTVRSHVPGGDTAITFLRLFVLPVSLHPATCAAQIAKQVPVGEGASSLLSRLASATKKESAIFVATGGQRYVGYCSRGGRGQPDPAARIL